MVNNVDPDQTVPERNSLIRVYIVCSDLAVPTVQIFIMINVFHNPFPFCLFVFLDVIHKFTRDQYQKRFPELESLVPTPMEYVRTVKVI